MNSSCSVMPICRAMSTVERLHGAITASTWTTRTRSRSRSRMRSSGVLGKGPGSGAGGAPAPHTTLTLLSQSDPRGDFDPRTVLSGILPCAGVVRVGDLRACYQAGVFHELHTGRSAGRHGARRLQGGLSLLACLVGVFCAAVSPIPDAVSAPRVEKEKLAIATRAAKTQDTSASQTVSAPTEPPSTRLTPPARARLLCRHS